MAPVPKKTPVKKKTQKRESGTSPKKSGKARKIFLVDDHPILIKGLTALLDGEPDLTVCGSAMDAQGTMEGIAATQPDLVILDISLKGLNGLDLIKMIKSEFKDIPALFLSVHEEFFYAERALMAGAMGYVMKEEMSERILDAIRKILGGEIYVSDRVGGQMLNQMVRGKSQAISSPIDLLSNHELQVLQYIGEGHSNQQIAAHMNLSVKTIEAHRSRIREKLKLRNSVELIKFAVHWVEHESDFVAKTDLLSSPKREKKDDSQDR